MDYDGLTRNIKRLKKKGFETGSIGRSEEGRELYFVSVGRGTDSVIIQGAIHAREHITCDLILELIEYTADKLPFGKVYFVPMTNPDGAEICIHGLKTVSKKRRELLEKTLNGYPLYLYKANANMVDLNTNFDARFASGEKNVFTPSPQNYVGRYPFSESETRALRDFTNAVSPIGTLSYHTKGEVIYYRFHQRNMARDLSVAESIGRETGYAIGFEGVSAGGYKDWCIEKKKIIALTVEVGADTVPHPIGREYLPKLFLENKNVPTRFLKECYKNGI